jgi:hypothetical protein
MIHLSQRKLGAIVIVISLIAIASAVGTVLCFRPKDSKVLVVPYCESIEGDCGDRTIKMILDYYGFHLTIPEIIAGKYMKTFEAYMAEFGLQTTKFYTDYPLAPEDARMATSKNFIVEQINLGRPIDAGWANPPHKVLIVGYEDNGNVIVYHDGGGGPTGAYNKASLHDFVITHSLIDCRSVWR